MPSSFQNAEFFNQQHVRADAPAITTLGEAAAELGFDGFAAIAWFPTPATRPATHVISNLPEGWLRLYRERRYSLVDPIASWCKSTEAPLAWSDAVLAQAPKFKEDAAAFGIRHGWSQAVHDGLGVKGMFNLARGDKPLDANELRNKQGAMQLLAHRAHRLVLAELRAQCAARLQEMLTTRELDVLRWAADGKTAQDTATLLGIRLTTVRFHVNNAVRKLQAGNIAGAVFRALVLGLLHGLPTAAPPSHQDDL